MMYNIIGRYGYNPVELIDSIEDSTPDKREVREMFSEYWTSFGVGQKGSKWNLWIEDQNKNKIDLQP